MDKMTAYRQAVALVGDAPADELSSFIAQHFGMVIEPRFIPVFRASLRELERTDHVRKAAGGHGPAEGNPHGSSTPRQTGVPALTAGRQELVEVRDLALKLLADHGLHDWSFAYNRRKKAMGLCVYRRRTIELSVYFVQRNSREEVLDTILHEIAHALVGPGHGHDAAWKRKCVEIGARPERCGQADMPEGVWQARCGGCGGKFHRHRKPRNLRGWFCRQCGPERGRFAWQQVEACQKEESHLPGEAGGKKGAC